MGNHIRELGERMAMRAHRMSQVPHNVLIARVLAYDPQHDAIKVNFDHVDTQSQEPHWIPIGRQWVGNNYGVQSGPEPGALAVILTLNPEGSDLICVTWYYNDNAQSLGTPSKEYWIQDNKGDAVKLTQDGISQGDGKGSVTLVGANYALISAPDARMGSLSSITGNPNRIIREKDIYPLITALNSHTHNGVTTGSGVSGAPSSSFSNPAGSNSAKAGD